MIVTDYHVRAGAQCPGTFLPVAEVAPSPHDRESLIGLCRVCKAWANAHVTRRLPMSRTFDTSDGGEL